MARIPAQAADQFGLFTAAQALQAGWSRAALTRAGASGRLERVRAGVYRRPDGTGCRAAAVGSPGNHERLRTACKLAGAAAALKITGSVISHEAAAVIHELPLLGEPAARPCLILPPHVRRAEAGVHVHRTRLSPGQIVRAGELRVTDAARTCLDLARESGLTAGLVAADQALRQGATTGERLAVAYHLMQGRGGSASARKVLALADGRHESPLETLSALELNALAEPPAPQVTLLGPWGQFLARVDFYWARLGVVGEADGRAKYSNDELWRQKQREDRLAEHGLLVVRWGYAEVMRPEVLLALVQRTLRRAEALRAAGYARTAHPLPRPR